MSDNETKPLQAEPDEGATGESAPPPADGAAASPTPPAADVEPVVSEVEKAKADVARFRDQWLRSAADFDNFRKRARKDVEDAQRRGLEQALLELLPVADNLQRAVEAAAHAKDVQSLVEGVRMVLKYLEDALHRLGVERVQSVGKPFDPSEHEAVQQVETSEVELGTVVGEMMPGYRLGPKLLRAAMVSVARPPSVSVAPSASVPPVSEDTPEPTH